MEKETHEHQKKRESASNNNGNDMRIIARSTLRQFWEIHPDAEQPLKAWYDEASRAEWNSPTDIKSTYRNASIIANNLNCSRSLRH